MLVTVEYMAKQGCSDKQIFEKLQIHPSTFYEWLNTNTDFSEAYKRGKDNSDEYLTLEAESGLVKLMRGYEWEQKTTKLIPGPDAKKPQIREQTIKTMRTDPNLGAIIFWLNNRKSDRWNNNNYNNASETEVEIDLEIE